MKLFTIQNDKTICLLCPHRCILSEKNPIGQCKIRIFDKASLSIINPHQGVISAFAIDPIERNLFIIGILPLISTQLVSMVALSNAISAKIIILVKIHLPENSIALSPKDLVLFLKEKKATQVAFTAEPLLYADYLHKHFLFSKRII